MKIVEVERERLGDIPLRVGHSIDVSINLNARETYECLTSYTLCTQAQKAAKYPASTPTITIQQACFIHAAA